MTITISKRALRIVVAVTAALGVFGIGSAAVAAWLSTGSGSAAAKATSAQNSTIAAVTPVAANDLFPGATRSAQVTISNPNPYPVVVTSISSGSSAVVNTACAAGTVTSDAVPTNTSGIAQSTSGNPVTIAAGGSGTYSLTTRMTANPDNSCQGQSFALSLTATLQSNA